MVSRTRALDSYVCVTFDISGCLKVISQKWFGFFFFFCFGFAAMSFKKPEKQKSLHITLELIRFYLKVNLQSSFNDGSCKMAACYHLFNDSKLYFNAHRRLNTKQVILVGVRNSYMADFTHFVVSLPPPLLFFLYHLLCLELAIYAVGLSELSQSLLIYPSTRLKGTYLMPPPLL